MNKDDPSILPSDANAIPRLFDRYMADAFEQLAAAGAAAERALYDQVVMHHLHMSISQGAFSPSDAATTVAFASLLASRVIEERRAFFKAAPAPE
jgi:hypothetical protein